MLNSHRKGAKCIFIHLQCFDNAAKPEAAKAKSFLKFTICTITQNSVLEEATHLIEYFKKEAGKPLEIDFAVNVAIINVLWQLVASKRAP